MATAELGFDRMNPRRILKFMSADFSSPLKRSHSNELIPPSLSELRVVLLGGDWSQRNLVRTLIVGGKDFTTQPNSFIKITGFLGNRKISVINTPDLQFPSVKEITEFVRKCAAASDPGPHVFLLVLQPESFTEEEKSRIHQVLYHFNDQSFDHSLIMILNPRQESSGLMEECMKNPPLKNLMRVCRYRYLFQMMVEPQELLTRFDEIVKVNNGEHVSFYEFAEEEFSGVSVHVDEVEDSSQTTKQIPQDLSKDAISFRIVLLGENENKKAELVNQVIRNQELVIQKPSSQCVAYCGKLRGKPVTMVTFPDLFSLTESERRAEVKSCRDLCHPGPNVLLLLVNPSAFDKNQRQKLNPILSLFGRDALKHSVVIITQDSKLNYPVTDKLIMDCEERFYEMFSADTGKHEQLMKEIENIVKKNQKDTTDLFEGEGKSKNEDCLRIVLIGKTGSGKSSSGNTILGKEEFRAATSPDSVTKICQKAECDVNGRHVVVVDTPGLFDTTLTSDEVNEELKKCFSLVSPGPHVFLLVLPIGRFTKGEDTKTLELMEEVLGENYKKFTIVLFTKGDALEHEDISIQEYIKIGCDEACKKLITDCGGRYHVFNNYKKKNRSQVTDLIKMINMMVKENEGICYTREMLYGVNI